MANEQTHEQLLKEVLDQVVQNNRQLRPGTPMAELKSAVEAALGALPPLQLEENTKVIDDANAAKSLVDRAPQLIGWDADKIVEWIEELSKKN
jgi:hypothetical protein